MAMNGVVMGDAVWAAVKATTGYVPTAPADAKGKAVWEAICNAIVAHIAANAEVAPGTFIAPGGLGGGPVTGIGGPVT